MIFFEVYCDHRDRHVRTHSFPTRRSSDLGKSDPSKTSIKFHCCHGHHVGIPVGAAPEPEAVFTDKAVPARIVPGLSPSTHSDTFRPDRKSTRLNSSH